MKGDNWGNKSRPLLVDKIPPIPVGLLHFSTLHVISCRLDAGLCDRSYSTAIRALSFLSSLCFSLYSIEFDKANGKRAQTPLPALLFKMYVLIIPRLVSRC